MPGLEYPRPDWPARTSVVGPLHWDPATADLDPPAGGGPLLFVAGSTAASGRPGLVTAALAALPELAALPALGARPELAGARLVGTSLDAYPDPLPPGARIGPGRQAPLLARAAVAILGGGHGGVTKALSYGVPVIVLAGGGDQREVARRVCWAGAGIALRTADPTRLAQSVRTVLADPAYRAAANRLASAPAPADPVATVEAVIATGSAECAQPYEPAE
jgi:UDP:flavonoid glycosyltransferase YjiC (YdhE family)